MLKIQLKIRSELIFHPSSYLADLRSQSLIGSATEFAAVKKISQREAAWDALGTSLSRIEKILFVWPFGMVKLTFSEAASNNWMHLFEPAHSIEPAIKRQRKIKAFNMQSLLFCNSYLCTNLNRIYSVQQQPWFSGNQMESSLLSGVNFHGRNRATESYPRVAEWKYPCNRIGNEDAP